MKSKAVWIIVLMVFGLYSCKEKQTIGGNTQSLSSIPIRYTATTDPHLRKYQDTLYRSGEKYSGYLYSLYPNGDSMLVESWLNGVEEGQLRKWYSNRQISEIRNYSKGEKQGVQEGWWPNGKCRFRYTIIDDKYEGELKEWNKEGLLYKDFHYSNGQEEGSEKMWWNNGGVRANYVVIKGRRYGLMGMKLCSNPNIQPIK